MRVPKLAWSKFVSSARLALIYFLFFAIAGAFLPYLPVYLQSLGFGAADIGAVLAVGTISKIVAPNLWAWLGDHIEQRMRLIRVGVVLSVLAFALLAGVDTRFWPVALVLALHSLFWNGVLPQFEVVTLRHLHGREADYGGVRLWGSIGFVLAVLVVGAQTQVHGIELLLPIVFGLQVALVVATFCVSEPVAAVSQAATRMASSELLREALRDRGVQAFLLAILLMQASHGPYYTFFTIQLEAAGYTRVQASVFWVLGVVAEVVLFAYAPRLLRRFDASRLLLVCMLVTAGRWVITGFAVDTVALLIFAQLLHAISFGLYHAAAIHIVRKRFTGSIQGRGQALYSSIGFGLGSAVGGFASGILWDLYGAQVSYSVASATALAGAVVLRLYQRGPTAKMHQ